MFVGEQYSALGVAIAVYADLRKSVRNDSNIVK